MEYYPAAVSPEHFEKHSPVLGIVARATNKLSIPTERCSDGSIPSNITAQRLVLACKHYQPVSNIMALCAVHSGENDARAALLSR